MAEFGEDSEGRGGMEEGDEFLASALERDFVNQAGAPFLGLAKLAADVIGGKGDVVDAGATLFQKGCDGAFG